uniref:(northern house mosquito) hypothetical protein n=1 Tax=Culex pipiens TaxID=7175 RepID=A0A8D8CGE6_CULPI
MSDSSGLDVTVVSESLDSSVSQTETSEKVIWREVLSRVRWSELRLGATVMGIVVDSPVSITVMGCSDRVYDTESSSTLMSSSPSSTEVNRISSSPSAGLRSVAVLVIDSGDETLDGVPSGRMTSTESDSWPSVGAELGEVNADPGVVTGLSSSIDSELFSGEPPLAGTSAIPESSKLFRFKLDGAFVTVTLAAVTGCSKNEPVNEPQMLSAWPFPTFPPPFAPPPCTGVLGSVLLSPPPFCCSWLPSSSALAPVATTEPEPSSSSSLMSSALSICFWASFRAVLARFAIPVVSNQLIPAAAAAASSTYGGASNSNAAATLGGKMGCFGEGQSSFFSVPEGLFFSCATTRQSFFFLLSFAFFLL